MSFNLLPHDVMSITVSELGIIDMIRVRRVSIQWKKLVELTTHIKTTDSIEGDILTYFPKLRSYDGPIENLRYMMIKPDSQLLSLKLMAESTLMDVTLYYGIIRDYYRANLALKLDARLTTERINIPFNHGLLTLQKSMPHLFHSYIGLIGSESEVEILDGGIVPKGAIMKRLIYHSPTRLRFMSSRTAIKSLGQATKIKFMELHLTQSEVRESGIVESDRIKIIVRPDDPIEQPVAKRIGRRIVTSIPKEDDSDEDD